jgi:hypothetical protein
MEETGRPGLPASTIFKFPGGESSPDTPSWDLQ